MTNWDFTDLENYPKQDRNIILSLHKVNKLNKQTDLKEQHYLYSFTYNLVYVFACYSDMGKEICLPLYYYLINIVNIKILSLNSFSKTT